VIYHVGGGTLSYNSPFKTYLNFRNSLFLLYKNLPDNKLQTVLFTRKILDALAALRFLVKGDLISFRSVFKAHIDYYRKKKELKEKRKGLKRPGADRTPLNILNKSIVFEFYIMGRKTFDRLKIEYLK
jgi:hypothetical protein